MKEYYLLEIIPGEKYKEVLNFIYLNGVQSLQEDNGVIKIYNEDDSFLKNLKENIDTKFKVKTEINKFSNHDWDTEWKDSVEPVNINNKIIITPSWKIPVPKNNEIVIKIDQKM